MDHAIPYDTLIKRFLDNRFAPNFLVLIQGVRGRNLFDVLLKFSVHLFLLISFLDPFFVFHKIFQSDVVVENLLVPLVENDEIRPVHYIFVVLLICEVSLVAILKDGCVVGGGSVLLEKFQNVFLLIIFFHELIDVVVN